MIKTRAPSRVRRAADEKGTPPLATPSSRGYARAGRAGEDGRNPQGSTPYSPTQEDVPRETYEEVFDAKAHATYLSTQAHVSTCAIARRTGFMLLQLLNVWEASLANGEPEDYEEVREAIKSAADTLVMIHPKDTVQE